MKKTTHASSPKKKVSSKRKDVAPDIKPLEGDDTDASLNEDNLAGDQFAVTGREDEASSSGHRVEPVKIDPEENNAETLVEEGLHGYRHAISKKSRQ
jgi:hypothetical protein